MFRGKLEIQEPSQKDQDQTDESGSHCMKVKPGMWKRQDQTDRELSKPREGAGSQVCDGTREWCRGPALAGSRGYPRDEWHQREREREREKTQKTSLDRAKSSRGREREREKERESE